MKTKPITQRMDRKDSARCGRKRFIFTFASGAVVFFGALSDLRAEDEKNGGTLNLETAHFEKPILKIAKTVVLEAKLDGKGGGTGTLTLDPNLVRGKASTAMRVWQVKVTLKEVNAAESAKKGRHLYEVSGEGVDRLFMSVPAKGGGPYWLVIGGKDGIEDLVEMKSR